MIMLVMLKSSQKLVIFAKALLGARGRHVVSSVLHFLFPECNRLRSLISVVCIDQFPQFLVT